jgi:hypothetical protein
MGQDCLGGRVNGEAERLFLSAAALLNVFRFLIDLKDVDIDLCSRFTTGV